MMISLDFPKVTTRWPGRSAGGHFCNNSLAELPGRPESLAELGQAVAAERAGHHITETLLARRVMDWFRAGAG